MSKKPTVPPICDKCGQPGEFLADSSPAYHGRNYGPIWVCKCTSEWVWVGCHEGTDRPLGRMADKDLREAKIMLHAVFDPIWKARYIRKSKDDPAYVKGMARGGRYKRLAILMGIPSKECHIGMFDLDRCQAAIEICKAGLLDGDCD